MADIWGQYNMPGALQVFSEWLSSLPDNRLHEKIHQNPFLSLNTWNYMSASLDHLWWPSILSCKITNQIRGYHPTRFQLKWLKNRSWASVYFSEFQLLFQCAAQVENSGHIDIKIHFQFMLCKHFLHPWFLFPFSNHWVNF